VDRDTTENPVCQWFNHVLVVFQRRDTDTTKRSTVVLVDRHVLRNVNQTTRQVTGIGRFQGRIGKTFTCTVRGNEVLEDRQTFLEVGDNRVLDDLASRTDQRFLRLGHQTTHPTELTNLLFRTTSPGVGHHVDGVESVAVVLQCIEEDLGDLVVDVGPDIDDLVVALVLRNEAHGVVATCFFYFFLCAVDQTNLLVRDHDVGDRECQTSRRCILEPEVLDRIEEGCRFREAGGFEYTTDNATKVFLREHLVDVTNASWDDLVKEDAAHGSIHDRTVFETDLDFGVQFNLLLVVSLTGLRHGGESHAFAFTTFGGFRHVIQTEDHVLRRNCNRTTVSGRQDVVAREHEQLGFQRSVMRERNVHSHLVTIEVGVEGRTNEWVQTDRFPFNQYRLECLDTETVKRRRTVQEDRTTLDHFFQDIPDIAGATVHYFLGALHRFHDAALDELADHEWLEELNGHLLWQTTLVQLQLRTDNDNRTTGVVDTLTEEVLTEATLLTLQHVREGLEGAVGVTPDGVGLTGVVEQGVDRFLQHALLITQDHFRSLDINQALEAVVANDDAAIEIVQIRRGEATTFEWHQRAQLRRDHGDHAHDHPLGAVFDAAIGFAEGLGYGQTLERLSFTLLTSLRLDLETQFLGEAHEVRALEQLFNSLATDHGDELFWIVVLEAIVVLADLIQDVEILVFGEKLLLFDAQGSGATRVDDDVVLVIDDLLEIL